MRSWLRRIRGALGMGLIWSIPNFFVGVAVAVVGWEFGVDAFGNGFLWLAFNSAVSAVTGFICGGAFSLIVSLAERRRRFDEMSLPRFAAWGALGGLSVAATLTAAIGWGTPSLVANLAALALVSAGCAAGSLALARAAEDQELLEASDEVAQVGLTEKETRQLLLG